MAASSVTVRLVDSHLWTQWYPFMEMKITREGTNMKPRMSFQVQGLDPDRQYDVYLEFCRVDAWQYFNRKWQQNGPAAPPDLPQHVRPNGGVRSGKEWMAEPISFWKILLGTRTSIQTSVLVPLIGNHHYAPILTIVDVESRRDVRNMCFLNAAFLAVSNYYNMQIGQYKANLYAAETRFPLKGAKNQCQLMMKPAYDYVNQGYVIDLKGVRTIVTEEEHPAEMIEKVLTEPGQEGTMRAFKIPPTSGRTRYARDVAQILTRQDLPIDEATDRFSLLEYDHGYLFEGGDKSWVDAAVKDMLSFLGLSYEDVKDRAEEIENELNRRRGFI
ncbi:unnamed protein product [Caenorhabditis sp. 36 PRJEB53466]|nr:unnamed protein product [Caenorhabditis sp. 36 PRJEB53466]